MPKQKNSSDNGGTFMGNTKSQNSENNISLFVCRRGANEEILAGKH